MGDIFCCPGTQTGETVFIGGWLSRVIHHHGFHDKYPQASIMDIFALCVVIGHVS